MIVNIPEVGNFDNSKPLEEQTQEVVQYISRTMCDVVPVNTEESGVQWNVNNRLSRQEYTDTEKSIKITVQYSYSNPVYSPNCMIGINRIVSVESL